MTTNLLGRTGLGNGQADAQNSIGTELSLVGGVIKLDQEVVDLGLVLDVQTLLDQGRSDDLVHILHSLENSLAAPFGLVAIAELASLMLSWSRH